MNDEVKGALAIVELVKPMLAGHTPGAQGAVLGNLVALWLAGHPPVMRAEVLALHVKLVERLVPISEHELFGDAGHPNGR